MFLAFLCYTLVLAALSFWTGYMIGEYNGMFNSRRER